MMYRYLFITTLLFLIFVQHSFANGFEGNITFVKQTFYDTTYYTFTVKERLVRIDEKNAKQQIMQSLIINLQDKKITAMSPSQKMFTNIQKFNNRAHSQKDFTVVKSNNFKVINGRKCFLWRVRNGHLNMEVTFWVEEADFGFFDEVINILGQTQDYSRFCLYFNEIPDVQGYFPVLAIEKTLLRDEKMRVSLVTIDRRRIDKRLFTVPSEYKFLRY